MHSLRRIVLLLGLGLLAPRLCAAAPPTYYHLRQGVTFYVANPRGVAFQIKLDLKDINTYCQGAQTALLKVYDPTGAVLHDEDLPDDGITDGGYDQAWAGWDHELWARGAPTPLASPRRECGIRNRARQHDAPRPARTRRRQEERR